MMAKDFCRCQVQKLPNLFKEHDHSSIQNHRQEYAAVADNEERPSPSSLVLLPLSDIKTKLPVIELRKSSKLQGIGGEEQSLTVSSICLACIKGSEEIRELANCSHLYHRECLDEWVDLGHETCPLCRLKLLHYQAEHHDEDAKGEKDSWRSERVLEY